MKISIIIVNTNNKNFLVNLISDLSIQTYNNFEIIIVDNLSNKENIEYLKSLNKNNIKVIYNKDNLGFSVANNIGVDKSCGDLIYFINADTRLEKDFLEKSLSFYKSNNYALIGPKILDFNKVDIYRKKIKYRFICYIFHSDNQFYIEGCSLLISKKIFYELGCFDEDYFLYAEDIDLSWRAHIFGYKIKIFDQAIIYHYGGGSDNNTHPDFSLKKLETKYWKRYEVEKNTFLNILKNYSLISLIFIIPLHITFLSMEILLFLFIDKNYSKILIKSIKWNILNIKKTLIKRAYIQKNRKKSDFIIHKITSGVFPNKIKILFRHGIPNFKK